MTPAPARHVFDCIRRHPPLMSYRSLAAQLLPPPSLPPACDLRPKMPPIYNQLSLGACTGNALAGLVHYLRLREHLPHQWVPSRLFIYYNERAREGTVGADAGAAIADGIATLERSGVCNEGLWPYDIGRFALQPPPLAFAAAAQHRIAPAIQVDNSQADEVKTCIAAGFPCVIGFSVYASFESQEVAQSGVVPMPSPGEQELGGHAVLIVGYDDAQGRFIVRNSWGADWGMGGYCTVPYAYFTDPALASDCWSIRRAG